MVKVDKYTMGAVGYVAYCCFRHFQWNYFTVKNQSELLCWKDLVQTFDPSCCNNKFLQNCFLRTAGNSGNFFELAVGPQKMMITDDFGELTIHFDVENKLFYFLPW